MTEKKELDFSLEGVSTAARGLRADHDVRYKGGAVPGSVYFEN
uniref:Uncharacterized protein n=1 Tax=Peronospora matthiolae TaxID=2874970 RepID=A0AAV1USD6_9STRA